jgi:hypothetical protein
VSFCDVTVSVADPGSGTFLTPEWLKSKVRIRDEQPESCSRGEIPLFWVKIFKFFYADPGSQICNTSYCLGTFISVPDIFVSLSYLSEFDWLNFI